MLITPFFRRSLKPVYTLLALLLYLLYILLLSSRRIAFKGHAVLYRTFFSNANLKPLLIDISSHHQFHLLCDLCQVFYLHFARRITSPCRCVFTKWVPYGNPLGPYYSVSTLRLPYPLFNSRSSILTVEYGAATVDSMLHS
jgi:hypothetical protein